MRTLRKQIKQNAKRSLQGHWGSAIGAMLITGAVSVLFLLPTLLVMRLTWDIPSADFTTLLRVCPLPVYLAATVAVPLLGSLLTVPLFFGVKRWYLTAVSGQPEELSGIFFFFTTARLYFRSLWCAICLWVRQFLWSLLFLLPGYAVLGVSFFLATVGRQEPGVLLMALICMFCGGLLLLVSCILLAVFLTRYAIAPYLLADDDTLSARRAIRLSVRYTRGHRGELFLAMLSFLGWGLLCLLVFPAFFVVPYYQSTMSLYGKYLIECGRRHEAENEKTRQFTAQPGASASVPPCEPAQDDTFQPSSSTEEPIVTTADDLPGSDLLLEDPNGSDLSTF